MLDQYLTRPTPQHVSVNATITEKRASTDDAVRLLKELEEKALANVLARGHLEDNDFKARWTIYADHAQCETVLNLRASLNGKAYATSAVIRTRASTPQDSLRASFREAMSDVLSQCASEQLLDQLTPEELIRAVRNSY